MQIAIATSQGTEVDLHFGKTEVFSIYKKEAGGLTFVKHVPVPPYCRGEEGHGLDPARLDTICEMLQGCEKIYCCKIGEAPKEYLQKKGIETVECSGALQQVVQ